ncbi:transcriptional repressor [Patescibacteria group bacterium]|nr:transcriptional repressor [Patescibacteria group bacterium]MBU1472487.1 transcriptional repressor [Patescibacteria group bacterium]MBU2460301.1 transcriptional repressor [Patescibacteria group bacterium]MBU2543841.1 transcriptional repressor [Patescibacteria group bacterium]
MTNVSHILRKTGHRLTKQRQQILRALTCRPQSVEEIKSALLSQRIAIDTTTIYRTLDCLVKLGIVAKTRFNEHNAKYELLGKTHHHHLVCTTCSAVKDIPLDDDFLMKKVKKLTNFHVQSHTLEFFGLCKHCQ